MEVKTHPDIVKVLRAHTEDETHGLRVKLMMEGMNQKLAYFILKTTGEHFQIDGHHRRKICEAEKIPFEWRKVNLHTLAEAIEWVKENQVSQRNLALKEIAELKVERLIRVAAARKAGKSYRTIAKEEKVSEAQVRRDLDNQETVQPKDAVITGQDGKAYRTTRKRTKKKTKNGSPAYEYTEVKTTFGRFVRAFDEFTKKYECSGAPAVLTIEAELDRSWKKIKQLIAFQAKVTLPPTW